MPAKNRQQPLSITIVASIVLFITVWNLIRIYSSITNWQILNEFTANPLYILGTGLFWGIIGSWLLVSFWQRYSSTIRACQVFSGLYYLWYWGDRLIIQPSPAPNVLFIAIFSTILMVIFNLFLNIKASKVFLNKEI